MIVALAIAAALLAAALLALAVTQATREPGRHAAAKPPPGIRIAADLTQALAVLAHVRERLNGLRPEGPGDELWVDGLTTPALHADESLSLTRADLHAGLARHAKEWGP
jgi:hypothetical protein